MTQVEVIAQKGPKQRTSAWRSSLRALAGNVPTGNHDLYGIPPRVDPNFFALFENERAAEGFRAKVFHSGLSLAVYLVNEKGRFIRPAIPAPPHR